MSISLNTIKDAWRQYRLYIAIFLLFLISIIFISTLLLGSSLNKYEAPVIIEQYGDLYLQPGTIFTPEMIDRNLSLQYEDSSYKYYNYPSQREPNLFSTIVVDKDTQKIIEIDNPITLKQDLRIKEASQYVVGPYNELFLEHDPSSSILRIYENEGLAFEYHEKGRVLTIINFDKQELDQFYDHWYEQAYVPEKDLPSLEEQSYELPYGDIFITEDATSSGENTKDYLQ